VQEVLLVHILNAGNHLVRKHARCLQTKSLIAVLEEVFERLAEQLHHHALVVALLAVPIDFRDAIYKGHLKISNRLRPPRKNL
jgi:hypothetical protein